MDQELPKFSERQIAGLLKQIDDGLSARDLAVGLTVDQRNRCGFRWMVCEACSRTRSEEPAMS